MREIFDIQGQGTFRFDRLVIDGIDNAPVFAEHGKQLQAEETCLFHESARSGGDYLAVFQGLLSERLAAREPLPVVRFADGEYAFYAKSLACNGLYRQAESVEAIERALPEHVEALRHLAKTGMLAPLIHSGNSRPPRRKVFRFWRRREGGHEARAFLELLTEYQVSLTGQNYLPFYVVYAALSSQWFAELVDGRHLVMVTSNGDEEACRSWFRARGSEPRLSMVEVSSSYVATRWPEMRDAILAKMPPDSDLCLVGAGIGSLLVCMDLAMECRMPAIDAGHVLNMMNSRADKSNGTRLYTIWPGEASRTGSVR